jgi:hypothetical protein
MQQAIALGGQQQKLLAAHIISSVNAGQMTTAMNANEKLSRRRLLMLFLTATAAYATTQAFAKDGGGDGGDSDGDNSGSGSSGGNSGSGNGNSGSGGGDDDGDDNGGDDDGDDDSSGSSSGKGKSQDDARDAVRAGEVIPLSDAISQLRNRYDGRIIDVRMTERGKRIDYRFKVVGQDGKVFSVTINARNGRLRGFLGF